MMATYTKMPLAAIEAAWDFYERVFSPLEELAAQSHLMHVDTFVHMCADERIVKYVKIGEEREIVGMAVSTNELTAWPLVSPRFFAKNWPDEYAREAIWYVGFMATDGVTRGVFHELLAAVSEPVKAAGGMAFMDYCALRETEGLPTVAGRWARQDDPRAHVGRIDHQAFWGISYPPLETS